MNTGARLLELASTALPPNVRGERIIFVIPFSMGVFYFLLIFSTLFSVFSLHIFLLSLIDFSF